MSFQNQHMLWISNHDEFTPERVALLLSSETHQPCLLTGAAHLHPWQLSHSGLCHMNRKRAACVKPAEQMELPAEWLCSLLLWGQAAPGRRLSLLGGYHFLPTFWEAWACARVQDESNSNKNSKCPEAPSTAQATFLSLSLCVREVQAQAPALFG